MANSFWVGHKMKRKMIMKDFLEKKRAKEIKLLNSNIDEYSNRVSKKKLFNGSDNEIDAFFVLGDKWKVLMAQYDKRSTCKKDLIIEMRSLYKKIENQFKKIDKNYDRNKESIFDINKTVK